MHQEKFHQQWVLGFRNHKAHTLLLVWSGAFMFCYFVSLRVVMTKMAHAINFSCQGCALWDVVPGQGPRVRRSQNSLQTFISTLDTPDVLSDANDSSASCLRESPPWMIQYLEPHGGGCISPVARMYLCQCRSTAGDNAQALRSNRRDVSQRYAYGL